MITISNGEDKWSIENGVWNTGNRLGDQVVLGIELDQRNRLNIWRSSPADPYPDNTSAALVASFMGWQIIKDDESTKPGFVADRVY